MKAKLIGVGAYYPTKEVKNADYWDHDFLKEGHQSHSKSAKQIVDKFEEITEIRARRVVTEDVNASIMGYHAAEKAIEHAGIDRETFDYIIVAHNSGDITDENRRSDIIPNLASRVKHHLGIKNPNCVAYDIIFGCPGWLQAFIQAKCFIKAGEAKNILVVGTDTISRIVDKPDIDSMIFGDGAGAVVLTATEDDDDCGTLCHKSVSHCGQELDYLKMGPSFDKELENQGIFVKMNGKRVFRYAYENLPMLITSCLESSGLKLSDLTYILFHQANGKMLRLIGQKLFDTHGVPFDEAMIPMNIADMGNNSSATIPTLLYELERKALNDRGIKKGDIVAFASVGAGMHANCMLYKF